MKTLVFSLIALCFSSAVLAARFDIKNQCSYPVWPAALPGGGVKLNPGETWSLYVPAGTRSGRIWARIGCSFDVSGHGGCVIGDCSGVLSCTLSGKPPTTLAEFTLNGDYNLDTFGISVTNGFNLPMEFNGCSLALRCLVDKCPDSAKPHTCPSGNNYRVIFCP
ncbi:Thaumatin family [Sesbania bispinosa]|nr:Thaumatin family [Sesbania bispinosa]